MKEVKDIFPNLRNLNEFTEDRRPLFFSEKEWQKFLEHLFFQPKTCIRVNTKKISPEKLFSLPAFKKLKLTKIPWGEDIYLIEEGEIKGDVLESLLGLFYFQSPSSTLPVELLEIEGEELILDMCAAPGSKTTQIASLLSKRGKGGYLIANDVRAKRLESLGHNLEKMGFSSNLITLLNAHRLGKVFPEKFDKVLLDAPCSGEGSWFRHSRSAVYRRDYVKRSSNLQKQLIISAFKALKRGGILVYSTCTYAPEENEEVIEFALQYAKGNLKLLEIDLPLEGLRDGLDRYKNISYSLEIKKTKRVYPHLTSYPGFFLAKLQKL